MSKNILISSYYANMPGACQAEWLDDKIKSLLKNKHEIVLVSSVCSRPNKNSDYKHFRTPSISWHDFNDEIDRMIATKIKIDTYLKILKPVNFVIGGLFDGILKIVTKGIGEGRWSWAITSFIAIFITVIRYKVDIIFSTGGPASSHVSSIIVAKILKKPVIIELQDPLSGGDIGRNEAARGWLYKVEKFIVKNADKTVYVTKAAAEYAKLQFNSSKIEAVYPGAWDFKIYPNTSLHKNDVKLKLIHLGSLYATRTFESIINAIDLLISKGIIQETQIELLNLGHVAPDIKEVISKKSYVTILPPVDRQEALRIATDYDVMLLIQNKDERSQVTIPYKTYDYLNLNNKVLGLLNSSELTQLLRDAGQMACDLDDIECITKNLESIIKGYHVAQTDKIDAVTQAEKLITLNSQ